MMANDIEKIREKLKNINTDEEVDEIHKILDRMDGRAALQNPRVGGLAEEIIKKGMVQDIEIVNNTNFQSHVSGGSYPVDTGPVEAHISFIADPRDIYDN